MKSMSFIQAIELFLKGEAVYCQTQISTTCFKIIKSPPHEDKIEIKIHGGTDLKRMGDFLFSLNQIVNGVWTTVKPPAISEEQEESFSFTKGISKED